MTQADKQDTSEHTRCCGRHRAAKLAVAFIATAGALALGFAADDARWARLGGAFVADGSSESEVDLSASADGHVLGRLEATTDARAQHHSNAQHHAAADTMTAAGPADPHRSDSHTVGAGHGAPAGPDVTAQERPPRHTGPLGGWYRKEVADALLTPPTADPLPGDGKPRPLLIPGGQKCGSTFLWSELLSSPHVALSRSQPKSPLMEIKESIRVYQRDHRGRKDDLAKMGRAFRASDYYSDFDTLKRLASAPTPDELLDQPAETMTPLRFVPAEARPAVIADAAPQMPSTWYTTLVRAAFGDQTQRMQYAAVLCDPTHRAESAYWHRRVGRWGADDLNVFNLSVSAKIYADLRELTTCVRHAAGERPTPAEQALAEFGQMRYTAGVNKRKATMMHQDEADGFPPLPTDIDWSRVPDDWYSTCGGGWGNLLADSMFAQQLRRLMFDLVIKPLGGAFPMWNDTGRVHGLLAPAQQSRFLVIENAKLFEEPHKHVDMVLRHAGLPPLYETTSADGVVAHNEDAVDHMHPINAHVHQEPLHPRVEAQSRAFCAHEMQLVELMVQRGEPWFPLNGT